MFENFSFLAYEVRKVPVVVVTNVVGHPTHVLGIKGKRIVKANVCESGLDHQDNHRPEESHENYQLDYKPFFAPPENVDSTLLVL